MAMIDEAFIRADIQKGLKEMGQKRGVEWETEGGKFKVLTSSQFAGVCGVMPWDEILPYFAVGKRVLRGGWVPFIVDEVSNLKYQTAVRLKA